MFKSQLKYILNDLDKHKRPKQQILAECIQTRLDRSLQSYYQDLMESYNYLCQRNALRLAKKLNRS